jgi:hypothetical protein
MKYKSIIIAMILVAGFSSCTDDEIFEREQYKNIFALVSDDGYNIYNEVHDLDLVESVGYVAASCGGTNPTQKTIDITMDVSHEAFAYYNQSNFDMDVTKYAQWMPSDKYSIDNWRFNIPAGKIDGRLPVRIRPEGLSPDSVYFIPLKVSAFSAYELNPDKSTVLYRVLIKNKYATQETATNYALRGVLNGVNTMGQKRVDPIAANKVRIMAGTFAFESKVETINKNGIILEIDADNHISISSYKDMVVTQVDNDPEYPNIFKIENDGYRTYKTFLLRYDYVDGANTRQMKEELRLEFKEENK